MIEVEILWGIDVVRLYWDRGSNVRQYVAGLHQYDNQTSFFSSAISGDGFILSQVGAAHISLFDTSHSTQVRSA